jgi:hypothetical protein
MAKTLSLTEANPDVMKVKRSTSGMGRGAWRDVYTTLLVDASGRNGFWSGTRSG